MPDEGPVEDLVGPEAPPDEIVGDAGPVDDAGSDVTEPSDVTPSDSGPVADGVKIDSGGQADAMAEFLKTLLRGDIGVQAFKPKGGQEGCNCESRSAPGPSEAIWFALALAFLLWWRRRA